MTEQARAMAVALRTTLFLVLSPLLQQPLFGAPRAHLPYLGLACNAPRRRPLELSTCGQQLPPAIPPPPPITHHCHSHSHSCTGITGIAP